MTAASDGFLRHDGLRARRYGTHTLRGNAQGSLVTPWSGLLPPSHSSLLTGVAALPHHVVLAVPPAGAPPARCGRARPQGER